MFERLRLNLRYNISEPIPGTFYDWLSACLIWLNRRPRYRHCDGCGTPLWYTGPYPPNCPVFCSENCASHALSLLEFEPDTLPF